MHKCNYLLILILILSSCDAWFFDSEIRWRASIENLTSDTITITNSQEEVHGVNISKIVCVPYSENTYFDILYPYEPLDDYFFSFIYEESVITTSSGRTLKKNIFDMSKWENLSKRKDMKAKFIITETDLE
ncbi:hypothetical protein FACS189413_19760 [Bacteroidia bacterium]|nr:hypothetical protein FACS189413_19760 [Bacteroidia bacterium]